jgi:hypothetical protein
MKTTEENNRLIAEFLGLQLEQDQERLYINGLGTKLINETFNKDWNWLIEVVEKIESLEKRKYTLITQQSSCLLWDNDKGEELECFNGSFKSKTKIEAVYNACVEFIKWYNKNGAKRN